MSSYRDQTDYTEPRHGKTGSTPTSAEHDDRFPRGDPLDHVAGEATFDLDRLLRDLSPAWHADALCKEHDLELWFPTKGQRPQRALEICGRCAVRAECLAEALADPELDHGIRGGMTVAARKQRRKANP